MAKVKESTSLLEGEAVTPVNVNWLLMCLWSKFILFVLVLIGITTLYDGAGTYVAIGPSDNLILISVYVNTVPRYLMLQIFLMCYEFINYWMVDF